MKEVHNIISGHMDDNNTVPIPGLIKTYYRQGGKDASSSDYVPQGICSTGRYWLFTAYDSNKECNSVIYVVDRESNKLISTLTLPNKFHVGGIAFDGNNIWLPGETSDKYKGNPFVQYIQYDDFRNMIKDSIHEVKKSEISEYIYIKNKPSFLEYDNGKLWVGTYIGKKGTKEGYINGYSVIEKDDGRISLNTTLYSVISGIDSSAQGAAIVGKYMYVSSSYKGSVAGVKSSFVTKYEISPLKNGMNVLYVADREIKRIEVPKMNEELFVEDGEIHINFESAANAYIVDSALTLATAYVPLTLTPGRMGRMLTEFSVALAGAVLISGFVALLLCLLIFGLWLYDTVRNDPNYLIKKCSSVLYELHEDQPKKVSFTYKSSGLLGKMSKPVFSFKPSENAEYTFSVTDISTEDDVYMQLDVMNGKLTNYLVSDNFESGDRTTVSGSAYLTEGTECMVIVQPVG